MNPKESTISRAFSTVLPFELTERILSYATPSPIDEDNIKALLSSIDKGDYIAVQELLESGVCPNGANNDPGRPLFRAIQNYLVGRQASIAFLNVLQELLDAGAERNLPAGSELFNGEVVIPRLLRKIGI